MNALSGGDEENKRAEGGRPGKRKNEESMDSGKDCGLWMR